MRRIARRSLCIRLALRIPLTRPSHLGAHGLPHPTEIHSDRARPLHDGGADGRLFRRQRLYRQIRAERAAGTRSGDHRADLGTGAAEAGAGRRASSGFRCCGPTGSTPTCWTSARASSSTTPIRATWSGPSSRTDFQADVTNTAVVGLTSARRSANFKKLQNRFRKCRAALQCGIAIFSPAHAILSRRFELG